MNSLVERLLFGGMGRRGGEGWYDGRPVMVTRNDHQQQLYNGDVGVVRAAPSEGPRVHFEVPGEAPRSLASARLPECETVFATTVHKAQGSEFDHVLLVLPGFISSVVTRELLYTAATRARNTLTVIGNEDIIRAAISKTVQRFSGLRDRLWGGADDGNQ